MASNGGTISATQFSVSGTTYADEFVSVLITYWEKNIN
jgi:hypothetical protein